MAGPGEKANRKRELLISALLIEPTVEAAAEAAGIAERTAYRWLADPDFQDAYRDARRQLIDHAIAHMQQASGQAVSTLVEIMQSQDATSSSRVAAARTILELSLKVSLYDDIEARLLELEAAAQNER